jgi:hypothetical protein
LSSEHEPATTTSYLDLFLNTAVALMACFLLSAGTIINLPNLACLDLSFILPPGDIALITIGTLILTKINCTA